MKNGIIIGAAVAGLAGAANAQDLAATFGFTDMGAEWASASSSLVIGAAAAGNINTSGDITDYLGGAPTTALFNSGFADGSTSAASVFDMTLSNITATSADASGTFMITDVNGDTLSGNYNGTWENRFGFGFFDAQITDAVYTAAEAGGTIFEGNAGDSFAVPAEMLTGGLSVLLQMPEWFDSSTGDFSARTTQLDGILTTVPAPGALALLGLGGIVTGRRRR